jgi:hypothetical protein
MITAPTKQRKGIKKAGFTLVELMVAVGVMILILSVILVNYNKFDSGIVLTNLAYDIGLSVRKAQTYGISVKGRELGTSGDFGYPYGIHFDTAVAKQYKIFIDLNRDGDYDAGGVGEEAIETFNIQGTYLIKDLCLENTPVNDCTSPNTLDITFTRPNPDATVRINNTTPSDKPAIIKVVSIKDETTYKSIIVRSTGQISVVDCPRDANGDCL